MRLAAKLTILASIVAVLAPGGPLQKPPKTGTLINGKPRIEIWVPDLIGVDLDASKINQGTPDLDEIPTRPPKPAKRSNRNSKPQLVINENAATTTPDAAEITDNKNTGAAPINAQSPATQTQGNSIAHPHWYPVCLFIDQSIDESNGNDAAKGLADAGNQCGVNVVVFPVTIANSFSERDFSNVNAKAKQWCNVDAIGAERGSASTCVQYQKTDDWMCDPNPNPGPEPKSAGGCAEKRDGFDDSAYQAIVQQQQLKPVDSSHSAAGQAQGVLASIEDRNNCSKHTVNHEAIGHSALGWSNKENSDAGFGIENMRNPLAPDSPGSWSQDACSRLKEVALPNTEQRWRYDPNRTQYYVKAKEPLSFASGGQLFGTPPLPTSPPSILANARSSSEEVFNDRFFEERPKVDDPLPASLDEASDPERHKKGAGTSLGFNDPLSGNKASTRSDSGEASVAASFAVTGSAATPPPSSRLRMDEGAAKNPGAASNQKSGTRSGSPAPTNDSDSAANGMASNATNQEGLRSSSSLEFDESARSSDSTPIEARASVLRRPDNERLDPSFFNQSQRKPPPITRVKGSSLRQPQDPAQ